LTPVGDVEVLKSFYKTVRPWGFWKLIREMVMIEDPHFQPNKDFGLDMFNVFIGIIAQTCLMLVPMYLVLLQWTSSLITAVILVISLGILSQTWYKKLVKA
jgi:hypothetical protein